jgi:hypothetical protein
MALETSEKSGGSENQSGLYRRDAAVSSAKWTQISDLCVAAAGRLPDKSAEVATAKWHRLQRNGLFV